MNELQKIAEAYAENRQRGVRCALASIVYATGSTYRRAGARMLINENTQITGSISGGCLEADVIERALQVMATGQAQIASYDTRANEDIAWGTGLGCQGLVEVLIERLPAEPNNTPLGLLARAQAAGESCVLATVIGAAEHARLGERLLLTQAGVLFHQFADDAFVTQINADARRVLALGRSELKHYGAAKVQLEFIEAPVPLVLFGAGPDALPVVRLARELGWHITVVDTRARAATKERFREADEIVLCRAEEVAGRVRLTPRTVAVLMSHNYLDDLELLKHLLPAPLRYIGLLGPRKRGVRLLEELRVCHGFQSAPDDARLHSPIGLDIGADTPEEIALSIIAEIRAVLTGRAASFLKDRSVPIHTAVDEAVPLAAPRALKAVAAPVACAA